MRIHSAIIASATSLALALPVTAFAAPEEEGELVIEDEGPSEEEQKMEQAKALYKEGSIAADAGNWKLAEEKYEQAYILVPHKHGFAHKVGMAAYNADDCEKTVEYLVHFITYTDHEKDGDKVEESRTVLAEMLDKGCTTEEAIHFYHLSDEERSGMARDLYVKAEELAAEEKWQEAEALYEEAYMLVPFKIGFSHKVGMAAYNAWTKGNEEGNPRQEDCDKAHEYLLHFADFAEEEKYTEKREQSRTLVAELEETCVSKEEMETHQTADPADSDNPFDEENPFANGGNTGGKKDKKNKGKKGLLIGGVALTVLGAGGLGVGAAGLVMASGTAGELTDLASLDTPTGYPLGDYSDAVPLEQRLGTQKLMGYVGLGAGGALFVTGIALIAVHAAKNKKKASASARLDGIAPSFTANSVGASAQISF